MPWGLTPPQGPFRTALPARHHGSAPHRVHDLVCARMGGGEINQMLGLRLSLLTVGFGGRSAVLKTLADGTQIPQSKQSTTLNSEPGRPRHLRLFFTRTRNTLRFPCRFSPPRIFYKKRPHRADLPSVLGRNRAGHLRGCSGTGRRSTRRRPGAPLARTTTPSPLPAISGPCSTALVLLLVWFF